MKIAGYILILTFAVYLDFADCSAGLPVSCSTGRRPPRSAPYWVDMETLDMKVKVLKDPNQNGKVIDIVLKDGQVRPRNHPDMRIIHFNDPDTELGYFMHLDSEGKTIALSPDTPELMKILHNQLERVKRRQATLAKKNKQ